MRRIVLRAEDRGIGDGRGAGVAGAAAGGATLVLPETRGEYEEARAEVESVAREVRENEVTGPADGSSSHSCWCRIGTSRSGIPLIRLTAMKSAATSRNSMGRSGALSPPASRPPGSSGDCSSYSRPTCSIASNVSSRLLPGTASSPGDWRISFTKFSRSSGKSAQAPKTGYMGLRPGRSCLPWSLTRAYASTCGSPLRVRTLRRRGPCPACRPRRGRHCPRAAGWTGRGTLTNALAVAFRVPAREKRTPANDHRPRSSKWASSSRV